MDSMKCQRVVVVGGTSELRRRVAEAMPVGHGHARRHRHAAVFLMTNPQITGAVLEVTGGETLVDALDGTP
jgi:hypothetical protein